MFTLSLLSRGHGKLVQNKQKLEVYFEPEVSLRATGRGHILSMGEGCSVFPSCVLVSVGAKMLVTGRSSLFLFDVRPSVIATGTACLADTRSLPPLLEPEGESRLSGDWALGSRPEFLPGL